MFSCANSQHILMTEKSTIFPIKSFYYNVFKDDCQNCVKLLRSPIQWFFKEKNNPGLLDLILKMGFFSTHEFNFLFPTLPSQKVNFDLVM